MPIRPLPPSDQMELAAKELCYRRRMDPYRMVPDPRNTTMAYVTCHYWRVVELEILEAIHMHDTLKDLGVA